MRGRLQYLVAGLTFVFLPMATALAEEVALSSNVPLESQSIRANRNDFEEWLRFERSMERSRWLKSVLIELERPLEERKWSAGYSTIYVCGIPVEDELALSENIKPLDKVVRIGASERLDSSDTVATVGPVSVVVSFDYDGLGRLNNRFDRFR